MGKQLAQDGTGARIERHLEVEIELVLGAARAQARQHEPLALIAADREHANLVCPSCGTRSIQRVPRRRSHGGAPLVSERVTLSCQTCGRHASYIERGGAEPPRDSTMDPHPLASRK